MKVGILGFRGSGKSTLFTALAGDRAAGGSDPSAPRVATVTHASDERFLFLVGLYEPKKESPVSFELYDYPGLVPPGSPEKGFRLSPVRDEVQGLVLVVRAFPDEYAGRPDADPAGEARDLVVELTLADLEVAARRVAKLEISSQKATPKRNADLKQLALLRRVLADLEAEVPVKSMDLTDRERLELKGFSFLTAKPWLLVASLPDEGGEGCLDAVEGPFEGRLELRAKLEQELLELDEEERQMFMEELGVAELYLPKFLDRLLPALGMLRFYTVGPTEVHVWELERGGNAVAASGKIHTDLARGFIRAEVVAFDDLKAAGDMKGAKAAGTFRLEGKEYVVKDGDVITVRFSV